MKLGIMLDCSRNAVIHFTAFQKMVDILAKLGYTNIRLYTEDTYEVEGEPYFGYLRGRFSIKEIQKKLNTYSLSKYDLSIYTEEQLQKIIDDSNNIVFFGGAGFSTESGIPDFRSVDGLYNQKYE